MRWLPIAMLFCLMACMASPCSAQSSDWPQWRGPHRDGISLDKNLLKEWPKEGPAVLWQVDTVGAGYSSLAVVGNRIYTQGDLDGVEHILCLDAQSGSVVWAVQPHPVAALLAQRVADDFQKLDKNQDGKVDELEALERYGWDWNKFNRPSDQPLEQIATTRSAALFQQLDKDGDGKLSFAEAGSILRDRFERIDREDKSVDAKKLAAERAQAYLALDQDGDGKLSPAEVRGTALERNFGRFDMKDPTTDKADNLLTLEEIEAGLLKHEPGRDGYLTLDELRQYYLDQRVSGDGELTAAELKTAIGGYRNGMGDGPRGTPTVVGDRVYAEGGNGDVTCLDAATGKTLWHVNLRTDFGGGVPGWGYSESPLVVGDWVIVTPGGKQGTLLALHKDTGDKVWQSGEVTEGAHYSSPVLAEIHGIRQIVQYARESVFGVALEDGRPLWRYTAANNGTANCCDPIVAGDLVLASSAYGTGGGVARITNAGSVQQAEEVWFEKKFACHHGGMVKVGDYIYSNAAGTLMCVEFATGDIRWQSRSAGKGALTVADGMLYILGEGHEVALAEATPEGYRERGRFKIESHGRPAWAHPVIAHGRMYLRDQQSLTAYDIRAKK